jgi:ribosomal-protein-alanine N-acetyltransferase
MITIADATEEMLPKIYEIQLEAFSPPWSYETFRGEFLRTDSFFLVVFADVNPSGYCILRRVSDDEGEIFNIAVDKHSRLRGFGDALMKMALHRAKDSGLKSVYLEVRERNEAAIALYKSNGFEMIGRRKNYFDQTPNQPPEDALIMTKVIT